MEKKIRRISFEQISNTYCIANSYDYKLVCIDDKFSKPFKSYLGKNAVYNWLKKVNIVVG